MKFTKKDVENLKMIRDSDLELNDDLLDSLSKFTDVWARSQWF